LLAARARYGPFWIATTLVFLSAVAGNYASYVSYRRTHAAAASGSDVPAWYYDVDKARARGRRPASPQPQPGSMSWEQAGAPRDAQAMRASSTGRPGPARRAAHEQGDCRQRQSAARPRPAARTGQGLSRVYPAPGAQVGYSAILFYGYVGVVGLALFAALKWWFKAEVGLAQVWCTYGARRPGGARLRRARFDLAQNACGSAIRMFSSILGLAMEAGRVCRDSMHWAPEAGQAHAARIRMAEGALLRRSALGAGYALSIFIPVSCVCVLPYEAVRWALIGVATLTSGLFLLLNFRGPIFDVAGAKCVAPCPVTPNPTQTLS